METSEPRGPHGLPGREAGAIGDTGVDPELMERLLPHLAESIMVLDADWTVVANLSPPGGLIGRGSGLGRHTLEEMHPDDTVRVLELGTQAFATQTGWEGRMVVRMLRGDGTYGRYEIAAINCFDDPVVAGMVIRTREVVEEVALDAPGLDQSRLMEVLAQILPVGVILLDAGEHPVYANGAAASLLGCEPEELKTSGLVSFIAAGDRDAVQAMVSQSAGGASQVTGVVRLARSGLEVQCAVRVEGDPVRAIVVTLEDVTERRAREKDLQRRADHDGLTGLRNRAALLDDLRVHLDARTPLVVAYVDLDGFKAVNDRAGHAAGDSLLVAVATALRDGVAPEVRVARLGGDEFVAVAPDAGAGAGDALERQLRAIVADLPEAHRAGVSCSIGVSSPRPGDTPRDLLHRADAAMYDDKSARRLADPA